MENKIKKILLIDDEPDMRTVNGALLESYGYEVILAKDGYEALEIIHKNTPDLILLDLMMPGIDGYQLCGMLKHNRRYLSIPVIILSARYRQQDQDTARAAGADDYIIKPFEPQTLIEKISLLLNKPKNDFKKVIGQSKA